MSGRSRPGGRGGCFLEGRRKDGLSFVFVSFPRVVLKGSSGVGFGLWDGPWCASEVGVVGHSMRLPVNCGDFGFFWRNRYLKKEWERFLSGILAVSSNTVFVGY